MTGSFDLAQVLVESAAQVGKSLIVDGVEGDGEVSGFQAGFQAKKTWILPGIGWCRNFEWEGVEWEG